MGECWDGGGERERVGVGALAEATLTAANELRRRRNELRGKESQDCNPALGKLAVASVAAAPFPLITWKAEQIRQGAHVAL